MNIEEAVDKLLEIKYQRGGWNMPIVIGDRKLDDIKIRDGEVALCLENNEDKDQQIHGMLGQIDDLTREIRELLAPRKEVK